MNEKQVPNNGNQNLKGLKVNLCILPLMDAQIKKVRRGSDD